MLKLKKSVTNVKFDIKPLTFKEKTKKAITVSK